jgi:dTDP-4-dehydrorhamnose 3,5-epimerase-like enzyme
MSKIKIYNINTAADDRGYLRFCNEFSLSNYLRFYDVSNYEANFIRAWHGHKNESKAVIVRQGSAMICLVKIDNWVKPNKNLKIEKFFLSHESPKILEIPAGYANGFKSLEPKTRITFYSNKTVEDSLNDDFRFAFDYWNPWDIVYR